MSNLPDFTTEGYRVIRELGYNSAGGRITYLAVNLKTQQEVVIKEFCFAKRDANWTAYKAHEREIRVLQ